MHPPARVVSAWSAWWGGGPAEAAPGERVVEIHLLLRRFREGNGRAQGTAACFLFFPPRHFIFLSVYEYVYGLVGTGAAQGGSSTCKG